MRPHLRPSLQGREMWGGAGLGAPRDQDQLRAVPPALHRPSDAVSADAEAAVGSVSAVPLVGRGEELESQLGQLFGQGDPGEGGKESERPMV